MIDRGTKKWTSLMMPEHVEMLNQAFAEQEYKEMPILDEQQVIENNILLQDALKNDLKISVKYFADHNYHFEEGYLLHVDVLNKKIYMENKQIKHDNVIEVNLI